MSATATFESRKQGLYPVILEEGSNSTTARLFLGTQKAARHRHLLNCHRVSRIVCVGTPAFHRDIDKAAERKADDCGRDNELVYLEIPILDLPSENLLARLDECVSFIGSSMQHGHGVLVNCVYAQSRSAAVVVAYLMKRQGMSLAQAVHKVRDAQPTVHINPGFEAQLALYEDMGCRLLGTNVEVTPPTYLLEEPDDTRRMSRISKIGAGATYRWFLFACDVNTCGKERNELHRPACDGAMSHASTFRGNGREEAHACRGASVTSSRDNRKGGAAPHPAQAAGTAKKTTTTAYRCKACRTPLFSESNIIDHLHPIVLTASDSTYASFSRHGDGSSWLEARDAAAAAAVTFSAVERPPDSGARAAKGGRSQRQAYARSSEAKGSAASGVASTESTGRCTSVFTEVLDWVGMAGCAAGMSSRREGIGRISCPGRKGKGVGAIVCGSKLGAWSLEGTACSCGGVVKPAVQFTLSRIEPVRTA